jgi:hypothetical protein
MSIMVGLARRVVDQPNRFPPHRAGAAPALAKRFAPGLAAFAAEDAARGAPMAACLEPRRAP